MGRSACDWCGSIVEYGYARYGGEGSTDTHVCSLLCAQSFVRDEVAKDEALHADFESRKAAGLLTEREQWGLAMDATLRYLYSSPLDPLVYK